jgi:hypothetical protein
MPAMVLLWHNIYFMAINVKLLGLKRVPEAMKACELIAEVKS